jgi:hypothetical protein
MNPAFDPLANLCLWKQKKKKKKKPTEKNLEQIARPPISTSAHGSPTLLAPKSDGKPRGEKPKGMRSESPPPPVNKSSKDAEEIDQGSTESGGEENGDRFCSPPCPVLGPGVKRGMGEGFVAKFAEALQLWSDFKSSNGYWRTRTMAMVLKKSGRRRAFDPHNL